MRSSTSSTSVAAAAPPRPAVYAARWVSAERAIAHVHPDDEAAVRGAVIDPRRVRSLLVVLGFVGMETDRCGRFALPVRDKAGHTAAWLRDLGLSERTWRRRIEELPALGLVDTTASTPNRVGIRRTPSCRTRTRCHRAEPRDRHSTRQPCSCGRWRRWHAGRLDDLCRLCHRQAGRSQWRERTLPASTAPTFDPQPCGDRVHHSHSSTVSQRARSTTRRQKRRKSTHAQTRHRHSPTASPCFAGQLDEWLTEHRCQRPGCNHRTPSRPDGAGTNPACRCCWLGSARNSVEELARTGAPPALVAYVAGDAPAPAAGVEADRQSYANRLRLDALLASRPTKAPPSDHEHRQTATVDVWRRVTQDPTLRRLFTRRPQPGQHN